MVLIDPDASNGEEVWRKAPESLRMDQQLVGNVRFLNEELTVVEVGGRQIAIPTNETFEYSVDHSVTFSERFGITAVLTKEPIASVDPLGEDSVDISTYAVDPPNPPLKFADFGGSAEIVERARQLVELPLERATELATINAKPIQGVIFSGPPGTGKTLLARIIACQAQVPLYVINGGQIASKWWGQSERVLRRIFDTAAADKRAIIVIDEIDTIGGQRQDGMHEGSSRLVTQLLTLMDGFQQSRGVVVIGTTNRVDSIDSALRRPGRFDWEIEFRLPDVLERRLILVSSSRDVRMMDDIDHFEIAAETEGWSPADLASIWSEASYVAAADARSAIAQEDYQEGYRRAAAQKAVRNRTRTTGESPA
ncbi:ATP-binding protein [Pseudonocardia abyssalis]|uniref:ATP-binding protein n=1 Tax=Pseudonocardia abyssalis TaxID=2792008 RepID=A0ABS6UXQ0_9PSEU|nr:ATP-binding protein [Pseudonocardia abyssalis]MBW0114089.1 ATP-binding protein [Pseudonocardia abyssalis]MBW0136648.1 ATP-binding protein [Pseudonocardia abyssalis]